MIICNYAQLYITMHNIITSQRKISTHNSVEKYVCGSFTRLKKIRIQNPVEKVLTQVEITKKKYFHAVERFGNMRFCEIEPGKVGGDVR